MIHAASHFDHKKRVAWVPISMHTCGSFFYNYGAPLGRPLGRGSSAIIIVFLVYFLPSIILFSATLVHFLCNRKIFYKNLCIDNDDNIH